MKKFVHLHVHSEYSLQDGMSSVSSLVDKAIKTKMPALALTDQGVMFGIKEFYNYVKKKNEPIKKEVQNLEKELLSPDISEEQKRNLEESLTAKKKELFKPILGCEIYVAHRGSLEKSEASDKNFYCLVILAKNKIGYKNLCKLVSKGYIDRVHDSPRINHEILEKYSEGLIVLSACLGGEINKHIECGDLKGAEEAILWHKRVFGDDYYIELQRHQTDKPNADKSTYEKQKTQNEALVKLAHKTSTKLIATNNVLFTEEEHAEAHECLTCIKTEKKLVDKNRMRYTKQEWLKSSEEMSAIFADLPEAIENTLEVAEKVEFYDIDSKAMVSVFKIPADFGSSAAYKEKYSEAALIEEFGEQAYERLGGYDKVIQIKLEADYLKKLTMKGAEKRYGKEMNEETLERIKFELDVIKTMGFPGYFLIAQDFIAAARNMKVAVGPGRGSLGGSIVAYCIGITKIDPLKYDLLFERFLNRNYMPPIIDIDFDNEGREDLFRWLNEKYEKNQIAQIVTYERMATRSTIKQVAHVQDLPPKELERIIDMIPDCLPKNKDGKSRRITISNLIHHVPEFKAEYKSDNPNIAATIKNAEIIEGTINRTDIHPCGIIIGADDLSNSIPLSTTVDPETKEKVLIAQYNGSAIEDIGLIKMNLLGLKDLFIIKETLNNIKKRHKIELDIDTIPIDDTKTYELFSQGQTVGIFQFESPTIQEYLRALQPSRFEDLIAMNALYRPGLTQHIPQFTNRKHGRETIDYPFPEMEKRLKETYGITVYQEQIMLLSRDLAGFTRSQSDELRRAISKKMIDKIEALKIKFMEGAEKNGFGPAKKLEQIWADWAEFAKYAFCKSHSTCYTLISYQTAYLKANYPAEFMTASLLCRFNDIYSISKFLEECKKMGIKLLYNSKKNSRSIFEVNSDGDIYFTPGNTKDINEDVIKTIVSECNKNKKEN